jgi:hypothetical protein
MKFNWGTGIAIFYTAFVAAMISVVVKSCHHKSDLVKEDYYQLDLDYEDHRQKKENSKMLAQNISIEYDQSTRLLSLSFPETMTEIAGDIHLFRPSDKNMDFHYPIDLLEENKVELSLDKGTASGLWQVKLDWSGDGISYYTKSEIII